ncbi:MAG: hypothetical protein P4N41_16645 [Negativicutes bacterium]|nr:hypothetical protein [Negativicutes bacterium]
MEEVMKMNGSEAAADKTGVRISKMELYDIATMLGLFAGVVAVISLVFGEYALLP